MTQSKSHAEVGKAKPSDTAGGKKTRKPAANQAKPKRKTGRPTTFTQGLADRICAELAEGKSMRTVCKADDMPAMSTVFKWLRERPEFSQQYTKAKEESADALVEEMLDIADDGTNDWMEVHDKDGEAAGYKINGEAVQRSRLRVETRKWIAAKLKPKKYSEKVDVNHGVQPENPLASLMQQLAGKTLKPVADEGSGE